jgi:glycosyltransferase involved in cell wall biosynthesis
VSGNRPARREQFRVLVLTKRQYMGRDLIDDRYGRFRELPLALAASGAGVEGLCLSYKSRPEGLHLDANEQASVPWHCLNIRRLLPFGGRGYRREVERIGAEFQPDVIWACSDVPHAVLGVIAARKLATRLVIDLYDNFESYPMSRLPGVNRALRNAIRKADAVTCVSAPLRDHVRAAYGFAGRVEVVENAIPSGMFKAKDKLRCRAELDLPPGATLIGTAGALSPTRGLDLLLQAFDRLSVEREDVHLVLAGALDPSLRIPESDRIRYLGLLPPEKVPSLLSALDLSVVCNRDSAFGRFCFPQKLYESIACEVPVLVARVGAMVELLEDHPENTYEPDDGDSLLRGLRRLCDSPSVPQLDVPSWASLSGKLQELFAGLAAGR